MRQKKKTAVGSKNKTETYGKKNLTSSTFEIKQSDHMTPGGGGGDFELQC